MADETSSPRRLLVSLANPWFDDDESTREAAGAFIQDVFGSRSAPGPRVVDVAMTAEEFRDDVLLRAESAGVTAHLLVIELAAVGGEPPVFKSAARRWEGSSAITREQLPPPPYWTDPTAKRAHGHYTGDYDPNEPF